MLMIDGRYTVQAHAETDPNVLEISLLPRSRLSEWLVEKLAKGSTVGFDPWLHTAGEITRLKAVLAAKGIALKAVSRNLVDALWGKSRPKPPTAPVSRAAARLCRPIACGEDRSPAEDAQG